MLKSKSELLAEYPVLGTKIEKYSDYVEPKDYGRLLKPYAFDGVDDLDIFRNFLRELAPLVDGTRRELSKALELGCGPGRSTAATMDTLEIDNLQLLDLSPRMLAHSKRRFHDNKNVGFIESDTISHLEHSSENYDLIYSLWSFSHSVHQILINEGLEEGTPRVKAAIRRMIVEMMKPGAGFFLIHVDSQSEEQKILFRQWAKIYPLVDNTVQQTPSKLIFDEVLSELEQEAFIDFSVEHMEGDPIKYNSLEELLDVFLNFHLESHFNDDDAENVIREIEEYVAPFKKKDGSYEIRPGCFIYRVIRK